MVAGTKYGVFRYYKKNFKFILKNVEKNFFYGFLLTAVLTGDSNLLGHTLEQIQAVDETENLLVNPNKT